MPVAIAITLFFAAATSALGLPRALNGVRNGGLRGIAPPLIAAAMALWFAIAAVWVWRHG
ncbi:MAG TPA: hypothetical protein VHU87_11015 [Rhizomicrobium sp.]|jgi:hypothetical protein|nr:hypothetical protein [Rhizomicrobium sp.]